jgi:hypothetical protein
MTYMLIDYEFHLTQRWALEVLNVYGAVVPQQASSYGRILSRSQLLHYLDMGTPSPFR